MNKILVLNSGSSSLKFQLFNIQSVGNNKHNSINCHLIASGLVEKIGDINSTAHLKLSDAPSGAEIRLNRPISNHKKAIETMEFLLKENDCLNTVEELVGVGHRVVHGGEDFYQPTLINDNVLETIQKLSPLAPLHNPANLTGINAIKQRAPKLPQVAVFDTAFHQSIPEHAYLYGLPYELYEQQKVRRYGFHGTSHHYVAKQAADYLGKALSELKIISLHLGNGTSAAAIEHGLSIDTSMGMTPLEGLVMGTRCGDIDPAISFYLAKETGLSLQALDQLLNKESGLKGICGQNDMRVIVERSNQGDIKAKLAIKIFCYRIKKYIGAYLAAMNGADVIIFTGGIGENSAEIREFSCQKLQNLGISIDSLKNNQRVTKQSDQSIMEIQSLTGQSKILVIPTNEELEIAVQAMKIIQKK